MKSLIKFNQLFIISIIFLSIVAQSKEFIIYSIDQEIPEGSINEIIKKNYYLNMGSIQGLNKGDLVNVYRKINKSNPYENNKQHEYKLKVGQLKIIHTQEYASIGIQERLFFQDLNTPVLRQTSIMIGDKVDIPISKY